jgi:hypothetical protein
LGLLLGTRETKTSAFKIRLGYEMSEPVVHVHETPLHFLGINYAEKPELYLFLFAIFKFLPKK